MFLCETLGATLRFLLHLQYLLLKYIYTLQTLLVFVFNRIDSRNRFHSDSVIRFDRTLARSCSCFLATVNVCGEKVAKDEGLLRDQ